MWVEGEGRGGGKREEDQGEEEGGSKGGTKRGRQEEDWEGESEGGCVRPERRRGEEGGHNKLIVELLDSQQKSSHLPSQDGEWPAPPVEGLIHIMQGLWQTMA